MDRRTDGQIDIRTDNIGFCELVLITESPFHNTNKQTIFIYTRTINVLIVVNVVVFVNILNMSVGWLLRFYFFFFVCLAVVVPILL